MHSECGETVNRMLDAGESPNSVHKYIQSQGFNISLPTVYKYAGIRRAGLMAPTEQEAEPFIMSEGDRQQRQRMLTELEALDMLIEKGYQAIKKMNPEDVTPKIMMDAIKLKYELTGGNHAFLTEYGFNSIRQLEDKRWRLVIQFMMTYIDQERIPEVQQGVEQIEESILSGTPWQDEYLKAKRTTLRRWTQYARNGC